MGPSLISAKAQNSCGTSPRLRPVAEGQVGLASDLQDKSLQHWQSEVRSFLRAMSGRKTATWKNKLFMLPRHLSLSRHHGRIANVKDSFSRL